MKNKTVSDFEFLEFDLNGGTYEDLADALEHWAEQFWLGNCSDEYGDQITYLLYNMSKEMRNVGNTAE